MFIGARRGDECHSTRNHRKQVVHASKRKQCGRDIQHTGKANLTNRRVGAEVTAERATAQRTAPATITGRESR